MSITDELRKVAAKTECANGRCEKLYRGDLDHIADRIDAEHEEVVRKRQRSCVYYDPERHYCSYHDYDVSGYVELPKDADGETVRVGEELVSDKMGHEHFVVDGVGWHDGTGVVFHTAGNCLNGWNRFNAELCHHVQPDSWERIIEDAQTDGIRYHNDGRPSDFDALVERCKRLAGEDA